MIVTIGSQQNYLEKLAEIIAGVNQSRLKIILPSPHSCLKLQNILIKNTPNKACILPNIVPIINIGIGSEDIYNIPSDFLEPMSSLHQRVLLSKIIREIDNKITLSGALDLSSHVMRLFDELTDFGVNIDDLEDGSLTSTLYDVADHWRYRAEFLKKIYDEWQKTLTYYSKIDLTTYRKNILNLEIDAAQNNIYTQILAGIFPRSPLMEELARLLALSKNSYFIPPPMDVSLIEEYKNTSSKTHYYYQLSILQGVIPLKTGIKHSSPPLKPTFQGDESELYAIATNLRMESELIADTISSWLKEDNGAQIAVICKNNDLINMCSNLLNNKGVASININGYSLSKTKAFEFLILLMESHDAKHGINIEKFIILLKTHYLFSENAREFELELRKNGEAGSSKIMEDIKATKPSLKSYIGLAEKLVPTLWYSIEGKALSDFLYEVLQIENIEEYAKDNLVDFLKSVSAGARYHKNIGLENVIFMSLEDADIGGYDHIILADMNEGSMPSKISLDPWMNNKMRENLGLMDMSEKIGIEWYHFKNLLERKKIYITRSEKKNGTLTGESRFLQELISTGALDATT
jgi:inactivated superfamily I helicase